MLVSCWSTKGGAGTTVVAAALALLAAGPPRPPLGARLTRGAATAPTPGALLADLTGDAAVALGAPGAALAATGNGIAGWLAAAPEVAADAIARLEQPVGDGLAVLPRGAGPLDPRAADLLAALLDQDPRVVVADCGRLGPPDDGGHNAAGAALAAGAARSLLVLRPCFLALRRAAVAPLRPTGVVLVAEDGRALGARDVEACLGVPVVAEVRVRDDVARAVDAGLLLTRFPRSLAEDLRGVA